MPKSGSSSYHTPKPDSVRANQGSVYLPRRYMKLVEVIAADRGISNSAAVQLALSKLATPEQMDAAGLVEKDD